MFRNSIFTFLNLLIKDIRDALSLLIKVFLHLFISFYFLGSAIDKKILANLRIRNACTITADTRYTILTACKCNVENFEYKFLSLLFFLNILLQLKKLFYEISRMQKFI